MTFALGMREPNADRTAEGGITRGLSARAIMMPLKGVIGHHAKGGAREGTGMEIAPEITKRKL
ncbi:MAG TPA: hypothetical protein VGS79_05565 [Puia sp.]|nr:hypothetical protein [Puia sp.]